MTKRGITWVTACVLAATALLGIFLGVRNVYDITLTEAQIQEKIDAKLPFVENNITLKRMQINLGNNLLKLTVDMEGKKWGQEFLVSIVANGTPHYDAMSGTFHFQPYSTEVTSLKIKDETVSTKVENFIDTFVDSPKLNKNKKVVADKIEDWVHASIEKTTTKVLERIPVYTLPPTIKGNAVRMLLKSVEIQESILTLRLSFWQFTKMILVYTIVFIISVVTALVLITNPTWGIPILLISGLGDN